MTRYEPPVERMNGLDAGMYFAENDTNPLQIASVAVFEGPVPAYRDVVRLVLAKLALVPRYRQRVRPMRLVGRCRRPTMPPRARASTTTCR